MSVVPYGDQKDRKKSIASIRWPSNSFDRLPLLLLFLAALSIGTLALLPLVDLIIRSASAGQPAYEILLKPTTISALGNTLLLATSVTSASILIAVPIAWLTTCSDLPLRRLWLIAAVLPLVLPSFVVAYLYATLFGPRGLLFDLMAPLTGLDRLPEIYGFPGAFIILTLLSYPYILLTTRAALKRLDPSLVEAGRTLGLSRWQAFWRISLPQLKPAILAGSLLVALYVLREFGAVSIMRYDTFTRLIYIQYQSFIDRSSAASLALVLIAMTAVLLFLDHLSRNKGSYYHSSARTPRHQKPVHLGKWRWPAIVFLTTVLIFALGLPIAGLVYWILRGISHGNTVSSVVQPAINSFGVSSITALLAIIAAIPVAFLAVRRPNWLTRLTERLTYFGFALPGLVIALALVFFSIELANPIYQSMIILLIGYLLLFLPQSVGSSQTAFRQVPRSLEEAGRSLGKRPEAVFRSVTVPLIRPGLLAGAALVFLTTMKELPLTLILSPIGFRTLSTAIWGNISEAFFAEAALPALLLILLSSVPLALLSLREG